MEDLEPQATEATMECFYPPMESEETTGPKSDRMELRPGQFSWPLF